MPKRKEGRRKQGYLFPEELKTKGEILEDRPPKLIAGLFSGVGGFELGLSRAGHETALFSEIDDGANAVLADRFPGIPNKGSITEIRSLPPETEMLVAGFPCQDVSQAGKAKGIHGARSGLIGEVFRLIERKRVPWILLENVPFMLQLARGEALEVIVSALEHYKYKWAYRVVNSRAFGRPQRRRRVFLLASKTEDPRDVILADEVEPPSVDSHQGWRDAACGFYWTEGVRGLGWAYDSVPTLKGGSTIGIPSSPAIVLPNGGVVKPEIRDAERLQGFVADWTKPAESAVRSGFRWKLIGNAVNVDVAEWIGQRLRRPRRYDPAGDAPLSRKSMWPTAAWNVNGKRMKAVVSEWPVNRKQIPLAAFLEYDPTPLSPRATRGFLARTKSPKCKLRFPDGFIEVLENHLRSCTAQ